MMTRFAPVTKRHAVQLRVGRAYGIDVLGDYFKVMNLHGRPRSGSRIVDLVILPVGPVRWQVRVQPLRHISPTSS